MHVCVRVCVCNMCVYVHVYVHVYVYETHPAILDLSTDFLLRLYAHLCACRTLTGFGAAFWVALWFRFWLIFDAVFWEGVLPPTAALPPAAVWPTLVPCCGLMCACEFVALVFGVLFTPVAAFWGALCGGFWVEMELLLPAVVWPGVLSLWGDMLLVWAKPESLFVVAPATADWFGRVCADAICVCEVALALLYILWPGVDAVVCALSWGRAAEVFGGMPMWCWALLCVLLRTVFGFWVVLIVLFGFWVCLFSGALCEWYALWLLEGTCCGCPAPVCEVYALWPAGADLSDVVVFSMDEFAGMRPGGMIEATGQNVCVGFLYMYMCIEIRTQCARAYAQYDTLNTRVCACVSS